MRKKVEGQLDADLIPVMRGHDHCDSDYDLRTGEGVCDYHRSKVGKSVVPVKDIYRPDSIEVIDLWLDRFEEKKLPILDFLREVLAFVDEYWEFHRNVLDEQLYNIHKRVSYLLRMNGEYLAGGWMASPHQFSQLYATLWALRRRRLLTDDSEILRCGTASGAHTRQLTETFKMINTYPDVTIVDVCQPPLDESAPYVDKTIVADLQKLDLIPEQYSGVTGHVIDSFIPKAAESHEEALRLKKDLYERLRYGIVKDGFMVMMIGTSPSERRFNSAEEIAQTLEKAGFGEVIVIRTTDPLDYDEKKKTHREGNYFVVALNK